MESEAPVRGRRPAQRSTLRPPTEAEAHPLGQGPGYGWAEIAGNGAVLPEEVGGEARAQWLRGGRRRGLGNRRRKEGGGQADVTSAQTKLQPTTATEPGVEQTAATA